jgi:phage terminase small subunit
MPVLRNARHERFAQELASGKSSVAAYVAAGFKPNRGNAVTLKNKPIISKRVAEILAARETSEQKALQRAIERSAITKERVLTELGKIAFANMGDYTRVVGAERVVDLSGVTDDQLAAVQELIVEAARDVRRVRIKLADKRAALVDLARHLGMFVERHEHSGPGGGPIETKVDIELRQRRAQELLDQVFAEQGKGE